MQYLARAKYACCIIIHITFSYTPTDEDGFVKMKREVRKSDISDYSSKASKDDIDTSKDEEIEYRDGKLQRSSGNTSFHLVNDSNSDREHDSDTNSLSLSQTFAASGSYNMKLGSCSAVNRNAYRTKKKKVLAAISGSLSEKESLNAKIDKSKIRHLVEEEMAT